MFLDLHNYITQDIYCKKKLKYEKVWKVNTKWLNKVIVQAHHTYQWMYKTSENRNPLKTGLLVKSGQGPVFRVFTVNEYQENGLLINVASYYSNRSCMV
jgi:hypothetical protein